MENTTAITFNTGVLQRSLHHIPVYFSLHYVLYEITLLYATQGPLVCVSHNPPMAVPIVFYNTHVGTLYSLGTIYVA